MIITKDKNVGVKKTLFAISLVVVLCTFSVYGEANSASSNLGNIYLTTPPSVIQSAPFRTNNTGGDMVWVNGVSPDPDNSAWAGYQPDLSSLCSTATITSLHVLYQVKDAHIDAPTYYTAGLGGLSIDGGASLAPVNAINGNGHVMGDGFIPGFIERGYSSSNGIGATVPDSSDNGPIEFNYTFAQPLAQADWQDIVVLTGAETESGTIMGQYLTTTEPVITVTYDDSSCPQTIATDPDVNSSSAGL